jgi:cytochrome P450
VIRIVVGALLLLPAVPFLNLLRCPGFRRRLGLFPRTLLALIAGLCGYAGFVLLVAGSHPAIAVAGIAAVVPAAVFAGGWRARPGYGRRRRLPPGSLKIAPTGPWSDYLFYRKEADRHGPVFKLSHFVKPMVCIADLALANEFLKCHEDATVTPPMPFNRLVPGGFMRYMAPEIHQDYRARMKALFADPGFLEARERYVRAAVENTLADMVSQTDPVDPVPPITELAFAVFAEAFFGVRPVDSAFERLRANYALIDYRVALRVRHRAVGRALSEIENIVLEHALTRDCYFSRFVASRAAAKPGASLDPTLMRNFVYLLLTSWIDVADLLTWVFRMLADHPRWLDQVRAYRNSADSEPTAAGQLASRIVHETLRLEQSEYLMRRTTRDIEFAGFRIPKGWLVRICVREAHRDPARYPDAHAFDPNRFLEPHGSRTYAPFGIQGKSCVGAGVTLWVGRQFVLGLARAPRWQVVSDGPRELGAFHWRPSARFRVRPTRKGL